MEKIGNCLMSNETIDKSIAQLRSRIKAVFSQHKNDLRASLLMELLLSQVNTLSVHLRLIDLEQSDPFPLSEKEFSELMEPYLVINREIRKTIIKAPKSLYETESINAMYEFLSRHFKEPGEA